MKNCLIFHLADKGLLSTTVFALGPLKAWPPDQTIWEHCKSIIIKHCVWAGRVKILHRKGLAPPNLVAKGRLEACPAWEYQCNHFYEKSNQNRVQPWPGQQLPSEMSFILTRMETQDIMTTITIMTLMSTSILTRMGTQARRTRSGLWRRSWLPTLSCSAITPSDSLSVVWH